MVELARPHGRPRSQALTPFLDARAAVVLAAGVLPLALAAANGGYFPTSWGWSAVALGWVAALAVGSAARLSGRELASIGAFAALAAWIWGSWGWSAVGSQTWLEGLRVLVLPLGVAAVLLVTRQATLRLFAGSLLVATAGIALFSLATRLFPDRLGTFDPVAGYRLSTPVGYWNALGLFCVLGALLALGMLARAETVAGRALAAAALLVLAATIYFTFSRGSWIALGVGLVAAVALDPRRLQLLAALGVAVPLPAIGVWLASRSAALTHQQARVVQAARDGHRLALVIVALAVGNAALALFFAFVARRVELRPATRRALNLLVGVVALLAVVGGLVAAGGPVRLVERTHDAFTAPPPQVNGNLNQRLFSFSGNGRATLWRAAWDDYRAHPLLGSGAGSYEQYWLRHRSVGMKVRDAHSLYLETLAELGPVGLLLLLVALAIPLTALRRARHHPLVPALAGAYVAYLVHAGVDWDWEVLAVTLTALFCGAGILVAARTGEERPPSQRVRVGGIAAVLCLMAVAFVGLVGNIELSRADSYAGQAKWGKAETAARRAHTWAPWSSQPWQQLGEAQLGAGALPAARASIRRGIAKSPRDWSLWFDLARASSGRAQAQALAQASRLNPLSPEIAEFRKELATQGTIAVG